jgi:hypothetical protein
LLGPAEASPAGGAFASGSAMLMSTAMVVAKLVARPKIYRLSASAGLNRSGLVTTPNDLT